MSERGSVKRTRVSRSRAEWVSLIEAYEASGASRGAFCREHGVAPSSFNKAFDRLRGSGSRRSSPFVAVSVPEPAAVAKTGWDVELQLSAETFIRLRMS
jgi:transposase-like protein